MDKNLGLAEHWYPKELRARALNDEYLEWQHNNTRMACAMYFQFKKLIPMSKKFSLIKTKTLLLFCGF